MIDRGIPRQHYKILGTSGEMTGTVTSGTMSPMLNRGIGMGYVKPGYAAPGSKIHIRVRNKDLQAEVVALPIYKKDKDRG
jgi:aminomethyltransferase